MADVSAPYVTDISPSNGSSSIAINAPISFKVLDTPEVGSLGFTSIGIEDYWKNDDVSAQADGIITVFTTTGAIPYRPGTLQAFIDGILYDVVETNPDMGQFSFGTAPSAGAVVVVRYMNAIYLNCVDISSVYIAIDGVPAFVSGAWQLGYSGTITPVDYGYSFNVTTHPVFGYNTVITVEVGAQDLAEPIPNVLTTSIVTTFTTIAATAYSTPYIVNENPVNGTVGVVTTSPIDFDIKTDLGTTIILSSINVFVNSELLIKNGVPQVHPTYVASVPSLIPQGYHINIQAVSGTLAIQYYRVSMNAVDDYIVPPSLTGVYGEDFFEFSTDSFDFLFELTAKLPLNCPYDRIPDPMYTQSSSVSAEQYDQNLISSTSYWVSSGMKKLDIVDTPQGTASGRLIVRDFQGQSLSVYGKLRDTLTNSTVKIYRKRIFSDNNKTDSVFNSAVTYPFVKVWGNTTQRYLAGYPSLSGFPVPFTETPLTAAKHTRTQIPGSVESYFDDTTIHDPTNISIDKQRYLKFKVVTSGVTALEYDRYYISFPPEVNMGIGLRVLTQFSIESMNSNAEFYIGLNNNQFSPVNDGAYRFGVTFRNINNVIHGRLYFGSGYSSLFSTTITYNNFINKIWIAELELTAAKTIKLNLYDFVKDLSTPAFSYTYTEQSIGVMPIDSDMFTITSVGNSSAAVGASVVGSVYYVDVEKNNTIFPIPYSQSGDVLQTDGKWRPYSNTYPVALSGSLGLRSLSAQCSMYPFGVLSSVVTSYHVIDIENTITTIDNLFAEGRRHVLEEEDPTIEDVTNSNANIYRKSSLTYELKNRMAGILFRSKVSGPNGDNIQMEIAKSSSSAPFSLVVTPLSVLIHLATNIAGIVTTSIQDIINAMTSNSSSPVVAIPSGNTLEIAETLEQTYLYGGAEYKVSSNSSYNEILLNFRSNKTGTYYVSINDSVEHQSIGDANIYSDGTFVTASPIFLPTDIGKTITISNALNTSNNGTFTITTVMSNYINQTNTVILSGGTFVNESGDINANPPHFTWKLNSRGYLLATGTYSRVNTPQPIALLTQNFNNISDGLKRINVEMCKNMVVFGSASAICETKITTQN